MQSQQRMRIGVVARATGFPVRTLRYYEEQGLISPLGRTTKGYRLFGEDVLDDLSFVKGAKRLGLHLDDIRELLETRRDGHCPCNRTRELLAARLAETEVALGELRALRDQMRRTLRSWEPTPKEDGSSPCRSVQAHKGA